jgi:circadian clock protein KaiB
MSRSVFNFRLYVAGDTQNSMQALTNLKSLCRVHLQDRSAIEVVNLSKQPKRALADGILMTPTLVVLSPSPVRKIVGTLNQTRIMLEVLGLETTTA